MVLGKIMASDDDYGDNSNITYTLTSNSPHPFYISPLTGILKVNGQLDREMKAQYELKVIANDNGKQGKRLTSTADIEINIMDVNDNAPAFIGYDEISAMDGEAILRTSVEDDFIDPNGINAQYDLPIYKAYLNRNTEPGTYVKQVTAIDKDYSGNGNGLVMYSIRHNNLPYFFEIDSKDGIITTIAKFNRYNVYEHINLTIIASDLGTPPKSTIAVLMVNLQGNEVYEEDNEQFERNSLFQHKYYEIEVPENNAVPTMLLQINATNLSRDKSLKWTLFSDQGKSQEFQIDPKNGTLWLVQRLDREKKDSYKLSARADAVTREGRHLSSIMYPITDERVSGMLENEVRVSIEYLFIYFQRQGLAEYS